VVKSSLSSRWEKAGGSVKTIDSMRREWGNRPSDSLERQAPHIRVSTEGSTGTVKPTDAIDRTEPIGNGRLKMSELVSSLAP